MIRGISNLFCAYLCNRIALGVRPQVLFLCIIVVVGLGSCRPEQSKANPEIEITAPPPSGDGSPDKLHPIGGRVKGARSGEKVVLFARSGIWWVQPTTDQWTTAIGADSQWKNVTHPGSVYAALLVSANYRAPATMEKLPPLGGDVIAVAVAEGAALAPARRAHLEPAAVFSAFTWDDAGPPREMDIEISRWGEPEGRNAQYVIQPYSVPANVVRCIAPEGRLTHNDMGAWARLVPHNAGGGRRGPATCGGRAEFHLWCSYTGR